MGLGRVETCAIRGNRAAVRHCQCWTDRIADSRRLTAYSDCCDQTAWSHDVDDAGEIIGEHVQCHLGSDAWQCLHEEVGCSHPGLDRAEGMLDRLASPPHGLRVLVEPPLHRL